MLQNTQKHFVITYGKDGSDIIVGNDVFKIPPTKLKNTGNTTGTGDCFTGAYLAALIKGLDNYEAGLIASEVAAESAMTHAPHPSNETLDMMRDKMKELIEIKKRPLLS